MPNLLSTSKGILSPALASLLTLAIVAASVSVSTPAFAQTKTQSSDQTQDQDRDREQWSAPIGWSSLNVNAWSAFGLSGRCFLALAGGNPKRCVA